jgi:4-hydroxyphenylpyruvate dioxygenase
MQFNHLHFFVDDTAVWHNKFVHEWGADSIAEPQGKVTQQPSRSSPEQQKPRVICLGQVPLVLSAPQVEGDAIDRYLHHHPPGIGDVAFWVKHLEETVEDIVSRGGKLIEPIQADAQGQLRWCRVQGWEQLHHTLVQSPHPGLWIPQWGRINLPKSTTSANPLESIDHVVLNVAANQLQEAARWYISQFGFRPRQQFTIDTPHSGLRSQVLVHPQGKAQLPINEPATANSQVQEFLTWNRGAGVQHVALHTRDIVKTVQNLKQRGIQFLSVPTSYYQALATRPGYQLPESTLKAIAHQEILVDWELQHPQACLLQTFTQPLLDIPTLFFELIQRQTINQDGQRIQAQGFGERNFQALFEAIEREQAKRGSLDAKITSS